MTRAAWPTWSGAIEALQRLLGARSVVLMYHRVASEAIDPWQLCVSPARFAEHVAVLKRRFVPRSLRELTVDLRRQRIVTGSVAVSFDDGYADNFRTALPMLQEAVIPATFFVTSGAVDATGSYWWDRLAHALLSAPTLPGSLEVDVPGAHGRWRIHAEAQRATVQHDAVPPWDSPPDSRAGLHYSVWQWLRQLSDSDRSLALTQIGNWAAAGSNSEVASRVSSHELRRAASAANVEIGAHSVSHPSLPALPPEGQLKEAAGSKRELEGIIGRPVTSFAYPFGDYDATTVAVVRDAGFERACTANRGVVGRGTDPFAIPRLAVGDWDGDELGRRLEALLR